MVVSPEILKSLKEVEIVGGTVTYVFLSERVGPSTHDNPTGTYHTKSVTKAAINPEIFYKIIEGKKIRRSPYEILQVFEDTKWDLGASEFIIN